MGGCTITCTRMYRSMKGEYPDICKRNISEVTIQGDSPTLIKFTNNADTTGIQ